jgi:Domain of unknown function (DUF4832)/Domain of unknown function (DUF4874)
MHFKSFLRSVIIMLGFLISCKKDKTSVVQNSDVSYINYTEDQSNFSNPDRGFYGQALSSSDNPESLTKAYLDQLKTKKITLIRRLYNFNAFKASPISSSFLEHIQKDMDLLRANGFKIILRFSYTNNEPPPWIDAPENIILGHIDQLKPILQSNADVISVMEAGFIGRWGEWHTSSNKLDNVKSQKAVLFKLLDALPKSRCVLVRYQQAKKDIFGSNEPLAEAEAFNGSNRSRTGHHNDCFLASEDDYGTYFPLDAASLTKQKDYLNQENKFLPQEGETCNCNSPRSDCQTAIKEIAKMRWSSINKDYIACVLDTWASQGCYAELEKKLGYRFRLISTEIPKTISSSTNFNVKLILRNDGYASPYNAHGAEIIFRSKSNGGVFKINLDQDVRKWLPDMSEIKLDLSLKLPVQISAGEYDILLNFPDPEKALATNPLFSIRLANQNVWEASTGYNLLIAGVLVEK